MEKDFFYQLVKGLSLTQCIHKEDLFCAVCYGANSKTTKFNLQMEQLI